MSEPAAGRWVIVWDPFVRIAHWALVAGYVIAYPSEELIALHVWAGYVVAAIVVARVVWGFVGPHYARFRSFIFPLPVVLAYLGGLLAFRARRYLGHSPAGGAMVLVLLASLALTCLSGMAALAADRGEGPLAPLFVARPLAAAWADDGRERGGWLGEAFEELHETLAEVSLILVVLHVAGVLWASLVHGENLVRAMIDGRKRAPGPAEG